MNPQTGCLSPAFPPAVTSQSDGRCSPRSSEPAANQGRPSSASPPPPDKKKTIPNNYELRVERCDSSGIKLNHFWLTSVCEIPTVSPVLNARFRFSFCRGINPCKKKKETVSHSKQICESAWFNEIPCSRVTGCCRGCARGGRCGRRRRRPDRPPSCC